MQTSSVSTQESGNLFSFVFRLGQFAFDSGFNNVNSNGYSSIYFDRPGVWAGEKRPRVVASLSLGGKSGSGVQKLFNEFNRAVRFHCEKIPIGFASVGSGSDDTGPNGDVSGLGEDGYGVLVDEGAHLNGVEPGGPKKVLILMSDTGGGHRASAEAIKAAFNEEFGDEYQVFVTDLWIDPTPWPFNQLPRIYSFSVKHGPLLKMTYHASALRVVHQSNFAATSTFIAR